MGADFSKLAELIEQGEAFKYATFATKSRHGYASAYSEGWLVWTHHVHTLWQQLAPSPIRNSIQQGLEHQLLGYGEPEFDQARNSIVGGLKAANRVFNVPIPAADRTVSLGHNSLEKKEMLVKLDELIEAVEQTNDFPGDGDDKELVVAELSAGRRLLQAANVRVAAIRETLQPALKWIAEKAAGAAISKMAGDLAGWLMKLFA
jgi:hypothetical protein